MRLLGKLFLAGALLTLTTPLVADVIVSSPVNNSTVTTPVSYSATATTTTCSKGVGSMGVYVDDTLIYVVDGTSLSVSLPVAPGKHGTVVEEWDHCGGASYTSLTITVVAPPAATPTFSVAAGTYISTQSVTLSDATAGSTIYYTTNGSTPTTSSTVYSGPISVSTTEAIEAIATATGYSSSAVASASYTITPPAATPTFSVAAGTYISTQSVTLSDATAGATIYYTTNGSTPTTSSTVYLGAISVSATETIEAIAVATGYSSSAVASASYTITPPAATPTFSVAPGTYTAVQSVILSDATTGSTIYYTTNGATPTTSSTQYSGAIPVTASETIEAIAVATGYSSSAIASANYTLSLTAATPTFSLAAGTYASAQSVTLSDTTPGATIYYTTNGAGPTTSSTVYSGAISVGTSEVIEAFAVAPGYANSGLARADYVINLPKGPTIPTDAISATELQANPNWKFDHDPGTPGSSTGALTVVASPSLSGEAGEFDTSYTDWGGEIYHLSFGTDSASENFVYDAEVWIAAGSKVGNLEMDMNQVIPNGDTVIYGFQCDGDNGTWDYSGNTGALGTNTISWIHSTAACKPANWSTNTWHHVQVSYACDGVGNVTYNGVWLDGVEADINVTVPSAAALGWSAGDLLTNFQIDGIGASGASVVYLDSLTISRW
jgi:Chitobiase/beta-hexosaminidase C-terminal domain